MMLIAPHALHSNQSPAQAGGHRSISTRAQPEQHQVAPCGASPRNGAPGSQIITVASSATVSGAGSAFIGFIRSSMGWVASPMVGGRRLGAPLPAAGLSNTNRQHLHAPTMEDRS